MEKLSEQETKDVIAKVFSCKEQIEKLERELQEAKQECCLAQKKLWLAAGQPINDDVHVYFVNGCGDLYACQIEGMETCRDDFPSRWSEAVKFTHLSSVEELIRDVEEDSGE